MYKVQNYMFPCYRFPIVNRKLLPSPCTLTNEKKYLDYVKGFVIISLYNFFCPHAAVPTEQPPLFRKRGLCVGRDTEPPQVQDNAYFTGCIAQGV